MSFPGVAVITGAAGTGMGSAIAQSFAQEGCKRIAITDVNSELLEATRKAIMEKHADVQVVAVVGDISDESFVDSFFKCVFEEFGRIDYGVNCAGIMGVNQSSTELSTADFDKVNSINYRGCWLSSRAELKYMVQQEPLQSHDGRPGERGSIVNIASQLGIVGRANNPVYCASKSAVIGMTRCDAIDFSRHSIRVNAICPGLIATPMTTGSEERIAFLKPAIDVAPMRRMGTTQEVADCVLFLCSTKSSFIQGHAMVVDGGYTIN